jgi:hypothetical protein
MDAFAERTGLSSSTSEVRYLWTDAFAVCNYLTLFGRTGSERYRELAVRLVDRVHHVLGRYRADDARTGWISGLDETEGERHPTAGGLRIGKPLREREPGEAYDARLEWDRDGQYYHYLVRWMHALGRIGTVLGEARYRVWAVELAEAAYAGFVFPQGAHGPRRIAWKMSTDLTRPLVSSEGAHDPLDGLVTSCALRATLPASLLPRPRLDRQIAELAEMCTGRRWATDDPLGAGGLLMDACWGTKLLSSPPTTAESVRPLVSRLWDDSRISLQALARGYPFSAPAAQRLAFRELGLAIGLRGVEALSVSGDVPVEVVRYVSLADAIVSAWLDPGARTTESWRGHEDINAVMLSTALTPDEYLRL